MSDLWRVADVAVIGGGVTGLAAARRIGVSSPSTSVILLEGSSQLGGKVRGAEVNGHAVDVGPDAVLASSPTLAKLINDLGLRDSLITPRVPTTGIWNGREVRPLPSGLIAGVPLSPRAVVRDRLLSWPGALRAGMDLVLAKSHFSEADSVADLVGSRVGREVVERLVDPLLGGIYAGDTRYLSARWVTPQLYGVLTEHRSLIGGLRARPAGSATGGLATFEGGLTSLVVAASASLAPSVSVITDSPALGLRRVDGRWQIDTALDTLEVREVVLATPAFAAARLLEEFDAAACSTLARVQYASVTTVTLALDDTDVRPVIAGCVVPRSERELVTAATCLSERWAHHASESTTYVRCSFGRHHDERALALDDASLVQRAHDAASRILGVKGDVGGAFVQRWPDAMPQYGPEHGDVLDLVERARLDGLHLVGAAYGGIGVAACVEQGTTAGDRVVARLGASAVSGP